MATKRKTDTKKDLETKIAELEAKLTKLSTQLETKPPKPKPAETKPAPNRYYVRRTAPVGKVPTTNWNIQKAIVTGYAPASNQYFATRARMAYHPADKTFGTFSGVKMTVEGVSLQEKQEPPKEAPKPKGTLPKGF